MPSRDPARTTPADAPVPPDGPLLGPEDLATWVGFLAVHTRLMRRLDAELVATHGMPLVEYEVLLKLHQGGGALRMSELADVAMLSRSGLTRIVDVLEAQRLVRRAADPADGRVVVATLTATGRGRLQDARRSHSANVRRLFLDPIEPGQKAAIAAAWSAVLARLDGADGPSVPDSRK